MRTEKLLTLIFLLVWGYKAQSQQVISATNWLKVQTKQLPTSERNINVVPLGNTGYLFSIIEEIPFNFTPGWYYTSATLIKADVNGNVKKQITIRTDTLTNGYKGLATFVNNDEILWVVSIDSPIYNLNPANKKLAVFHIDIGTFSIRYVDTFPTPVKNATINNYWSAELPKGKFWLALQTGDFISYPSRTYIINIQSDMQNPAHWKPYWVDSICHIDTSGISLPLSFQVENSGAKLQLFATVSDTMMKQKVFLLDTLCRFQQEYTIENYPFLYSQGKHIFRNPQCNLYSSDSTTNFLGSSFDVENNNRWVGLIKARKNIKSYESVLLIPDVANMSYSWKNTPLFGGVTGLGTNVYCLSFDFTDPGNIYFNEIENHIYVGKTDTSLNGWHWYKYIGKPNCYLVPYKILATPDGGCMITSGIYDYVNSPNMQHDIYIIKLDANGIITSVNNLTPQPDKSVSLYPVPAQNQLFVSFSGSGFFDLQLYDMSGKMVGSYPNLDKQTHSLDISSLASGSYFYTVKHSNGSTETGKWIKE